MLAWTALLATLPGKCSGFQGPLIPGRADAVRLQKAAGRTASSSYTSSRNVARTGETCSMSIFGDSILDGIFGGELRGWWVSFSLLCFALQRGELKSERKAFRIRS